MPERCRNVVNELDFLNVRVNNLDELETANDGETLVQKIFLSELDLIEEDNVVFSINARFTTGNFVSVIWVMKQTNLWER